MSRCYLLDSNSINITEFEQIAPDTNRRTLQRDLKKLTDLNLITDTTTSSTDPNRNYRLAEL